MKVLEPAEVSRNEGQEMMRKKEFPFVLLLYLQPLTPNMSVAANWISKNCPGGIENPNTSTDSGIRDRRIARGVLDRVLGPPVVTYIVLVALSSALSSSGAVSFFTEGRLMFVFVWCRRFKTLSVLLSPATLIRGSKGPFQERVRTDTKVEIWW